MKTNIFKLIFSALLAHVLCFTVILAHLHAKDAVSVANQQAVAKISGGDITAKALGDLHHHIDKTALKMHTGDTTQARIRELEPLQHAEFQPSLRDYLEDFFFRFQFGTSLFFRQLAYVVAV